ncbi:tRNA (guanine(46)-N(7))-methyltransferase TrmB [Sporichthya polymorpha]|uniref:tRNA (guanine(46)-N(7))-methyltransferase TrmB n=1 Tax=Sporichthya polymorpha TaxID=35751 RepID=UPI00037C10AE|nr:methyltransferase domain-containing protein [Sporichthya polymorpha]
MSPSVSTPGPPPPGPFQPRSWRNRGRMSDEHRARLAERAAALALSGPAAAAAWAPAVLDIGFGYGESLLALAQARPDARVLGVDVHSPGQLRAMDALVDAGLDDGTVRVLPADVTTLLPALTPGSLELVQAFHPDPWPKRRHAARRLLRPAVLTRITELLRPGGVLHVVIDNDIYAGSVREAAAEIPALREIPAPDVPETKYGRRARAAGRTIHSMAWSKRN